MEFKIISDIEGLKRKILNEIEMLKYHKELNYLCSFLETELNNMQTNSYDEKELKKLRAELEVFLELIMGRLNSLMINNNSKSVFDNTPEEKKKKLQELEEIIEDKINYLKENIPFLGEKINLLFISMKEKYQDDYNHTIEITRKRLNADLGMKNVIKLSLYTDTNTLDTSYINNLEAFKALYIDPLEPLIANDKKVKEIFKRAYETLTEEKALETVKMLEQNYINQVNECNDKKSSLYLIAVQERMIEDGIRLDSIIDSEETRLKYQDKIKYLRFNASDSTVLEIEEYVNRTGYFRDEFYLVVYALIEKEKYMKNKYSIECSLYNKLSETTKANIEKIFLDRIKDREDSFDIIMRLKKDGYLSVLDDAYQETIAGLEISIKTSIETEDLFEPSRIKLEEVTTGILEKHTNLILKKNGKRLNTYFYISDKELKDFEDITKFEYLKYKASGFELRIEYYDKEGRRIKPGEKDLNIKEQVFDFYITGKDDKKTVYDKNFNKLFDVTDKYPYGAHMYVDYRSRKIILFNEEFRKIFIYDENFNEIAAYNAGDLISDFKSYRHQFVYVNDCCFNEGVFTFYYKEKDTEKVTVCYYDFNNMKELDSFPMTTTEVRSRLVYSEGAYPYYDEAKYRFGFKDKEGNIIVEPTYYRVGPFINGIAYGSTFDHGFVNRNGEVTQTKRIEELSKYSFDYFVNLKDYYYEQYNSIDKIRGRVISNNTYLINEYLPILDIDFDNKGKVLKKA